MAGMIPEWFTQGPDAELQVWRALRHHLPASWTVWHALRLTVRGVPLEIDFLCYCPTRGLVALEVKGGVLSCADGVWFQDEHALKRSPYAQVTQAEFALRDVLCAAWSCAALPFPHARAVWQPAVSRPAQEPLEAAGCTLYAEDLADPLAALERLLPPVDSRCKPVPAATLIRLFSNVSSSRASWGSRRSLADARITRLTQEQARTLDAFSRFPRLRVRGCAGSGKTLLALRRAYQLAAEGKQVLLLCFNLLLSAHLRQIAGDTPGLRIEAVNDLFLALLERTPDDSPDFWRRLARDVVPAAERFRDTVAPDAVIVDEGQDFSPPVWQAVKALVPEAAEFIVFYDPAQNIFQRDLSAIPSFPWPDAELTRNCRNTRAVCEMLRPHAPASMTLHEDAPSGEPPETYSAQSPFALRERLAALLVRLTEKDAIPSADIVLMGAHAREKMNLEPLIARFPGLRYFTYRKFKGLEAPVLILLDVNEADPLWDRSACYTAISRAIHKLILLKLTP